VSEAAVSPSRSGAAQAPSVSGPPGALPNRNPRRGRRGGCRRACARGAGAWGRARGRVCQGWAAEVVQHCSHLGAQAAFWVGAGAGL